MEASTPDILPKLTYAGTDENAETTSIAILALTEQQPSTCSTLCLSVVLGGAIILLLVLTANRSRIEKSERPKISPAQLSSPGMTESRESNEKTILNQKPAYSPALSLSPKNHFLLSVIRHYYEQYNSGRNPFLRP